MAAPPYLYSGPSPVASLATTLAGFDVNERRGDQLRAVDARRTRAGCSTAWTRLEVATPNRSGLPIVEIPLRDDSRIDAVGRLLFERGVYVTLAAYPLVPRDEVGFRVQLTAANTDAEVDTLIAALEELAHLGELQPARRRRRHAARERERERQGRDGDSATHKVIARYRALFSAPGFGRLLASSILGRLPSGMFSLALLLFVRARTDSFLAAGIAVAAFSLAGAGIGPLLGALTDRVGQTRVLLPAACCQAVLLVALVAVAQAGAPVAVDVALAALAGSVQPPIAGCVRALWSHVARDDGALETAYALDATTQELIWTLGPLLVGSIAVVLSPAAAVLACAAITVCGTAFFAASKPAGEDSRAPAPKRSHAGALASPGLRAVLATVLLAGVVIGAVEVALPALAVQRGAGWSAGPLLALFSVGSMAGGLAYSARRWRGSAATRYAMLLAAMAAGVAPLIAVHALAAAYPLSVLAGLGVAPVLSCQFSLVGGLAPAGAATEAFTWHRGATIAGMAAGSTLGGSLIDAHGAGGAFALGCGGVAAACLLALLWRRRIDPAHAQSGVIALRATAATRLARDLAARPAACRALKSSVPVAPGPPFADF